MPSERKKPSSVDEYIAEFPAEVQAILQKIRATVLAAAPGAKEKISYQMPAFALGGILVYVGAFKNHIGLYPPVVGDTKLMQDVAVYQGEKGNLKLPLDQPIPYALIGRIVKARLRERQAANAARESKRGGPARLPQPPR